MDRTELRQEANRLSRLAKECTDPRVRRELESLANEHVRTAIDSERRRSYFPSLLRYASWLGVFAVVAVGGSLALAEWYKPQPRQIVVTVEPHPSASQATAPGASDGAPSSGDPRFATAEHGRLVTLLKTIPFPK